MTFGKTVSERAFEQYLNDRHLPFRYEELPEGITKPVDYTVELGCLTVRFDVKEWEPSTPTLGFGQIDMYGPIRDKIEEGRVKFAQYKGRGEPCVLVLAHYGAQLIMLNTLSIFGAMRGDFGWVFPFSRATGGDASRMEPRFLDQGSMVHQTRSGTTRLQNTTISAVAVVSSIDVRGRRIGLEFRRRELAAGQPLSIDERFDLAEELYGGPEPEHVEFRVAVYDNVEATVPVPSVFPAGPYDERFGRSEDRLRRTYVGAELAALERQEAALGILRDDPLGLR